MIDSIALPTHTGLKLCDLGVEHPISAAFLNVEPFTSYGFRLRTKYTFLIRYFLY